MNTLPNNTSLNLYLVRHGDTAWALSGQHTSLTDIPLLPSGQKQAAQLKTTLQRITFTKIFTSPLLRARETASLAGFQAEPNPDLIEWDYGAYEGLTSQQIFKDNPSWDLFTHGCPGGESPQTAMARADHFLKQLSSLQGNVLLFSHGHFLRVLACSWLQVPIPFAKHLFLSPAALSILGYEHKTRVIVRWNDITD